MLPNVTLGVSNEAPLILTTSVVPLGDVDNSIMSTLAIQKPKGAIPLTSNNYNAENDDEESGIFFSYDAENLKAFSTFFKSKAPESVFETAILSIIEVLANLSDLGINLDAVNMLPKQIYFTDGLNSYNSNDEANQARLIVIPVKNTTPTDFAKFFNELFTLLPFTITSNKLETVKEYISNVGQNFSAMELNNLVNEKNDSQPEPLLPVESALQSVMAHLDSDSNQKVDESVSPISEEIKKLDNEYSLPQAEKDPTLLNKNDGEVIEITEFPFIIGRSEEFSTYTLHNPKISSVHARIVKNDNGELEIIDTNSTNHVRINEEKIMPQTPTTLHDGDVIRLADVILQITI
jgi:hypothetical protein